jgi:carbonic anhydrase
MDGRVQTTVMVFAKARFGVDFVDMVTEAGAVANMNEGVFRHVEISVQAHSSQGIVVAAHSECAGNPVSDEEQKEQCRAAAELLKGEWPDLEVIPVWVPLGEDLEILC